MAEIKDYSTTAGSNDSASPAGWPELMAPSGLNNSDRELAARIARWYADTNGSISTSGTDTYALAASRGISAYASGDAFLVEIGTTNTGAATLNVDAVGAKALVTQSQTALTAGQLVGDSFYWICYDATNDNFVVLNPNRETHDQAAVTNLNETDVFSVTTSAGVLNKITLPNLRDDLAFWNTTGLYAVGAGTQNPADDDWVRIQFSGSETDPANLFTSAHTYTAPDTGYYLISSTVSTSDSVADGERFAVAINIGATDGVGGARRVNATSAYQPLASVTSTGVYKVTAAQEVIVQLFHEVAAGNAQLTSNTHLFIMRIA